MSFGYFNESITLYTEQVAREYTEQIIEKALNSSLVTIMSEGSLMTQVVDSSGKVVYSYVDVEKVTKIRSIAAGKVTEAISLLKIQENFRTVELPLGYFFSRNIFLSNGIRVPININVIGSHSTDVLVSATSYGINSSIIEISLEIKVSILVAIPFQKSAIDIVTGIPLSIEIINSDVPKYYYNGAQPIPGLNQELENES